MCAGPFRAWSTFHGVWDLLFPRTRTATTQRSFAVIGTRTWNSLLLISEHQIRLCAPSSVISRPTCFSSSILCCWQVGSAPFVRRRCDCLASSAPFTNIQTYLFTDEITTSENVRFSGPPVDMGGATSFKLCMLISSPSPPFLPSPSLPSHPHPSLQSLPVPGAGVPIPPTPSPPFHSPPSSPSPGSHPLNQLGSLEERYKLPQWGLGRSPTRQTI